MPPGPELCAATAGRHTDLTQLTGREVLEVVAAEARAVAHHQARLYAAAWEAGLPNPREDDPLARMEYPDDAAVYEVAYQLGMGRAATGDMLSVGFELFVRVPALGAALRNAEIDLERAKVFAVGVQELGEEHARKVVAALLPRSQGLSIPRLKAAIVRDALALDPEYGDRVRGAALRRPNVRAVLKHDGSADVVLSNIAPDRAAGVTGRLDHLATTMQAEGDPRGVGELRALISICSQDGTWVGLSEAQILDYLRDTRPHPDDPEYPDPPPPSPPDAGPDEPGDGGADGPGDAGPDGLGDAGPDDPGDAGADGPGDSAAAADITNAWDEDNAQDDPLGEADRAGQHDQHDQADEGDQPGENDQLDHEIADPDEPAPADPDVSSDRSPTPFCPAIGST